MKTRNFFVRCSMVAVVLFAFCGTVLFLFYMLFPPTMIWQEFGRTPIADLGLAGKNISPEKAETVYAYRITVQDVNFSPGEYLERHDDDVAINNIVFTQDKSRVIKFMEEKGEKMIIVNAPYHQKALALR